MEWYKKVLSQYADFDGRARRKEYWTFTLVNYFIGTVMYIGLFAIVIPTEGESQAANIIVGVLGIAFGIFALAMLIPTIAVTTRRLHDTGRTGWFQLLRFVPFGNLVLLIFTIQDSHPGGNIYGPNPKDLGNGPTTIEI